MTKLQQVGSVILFAVGSLLALLGITSLVIDPPNDVPAHISQTMTQFFVIAGIVGIGMVAFGAYVRSGPISSRVAKLVWGIYAFFLLVLILLSVFVWSDVARAISETNRPGRAVSGLIFLMVFLAAPIVELVRRYRTYR